MERIKLIMTALASKFVKLMKGIRKCLEGICGKENKVWRVTGSEREDLWWQKFKSFLLGSQDLKVNLCGLQQDIRSDGV